MFSGFKDFDIEHILECGQCFRFCKQDDKKYKLVAYGREIVVSQTADRIIIEKSSKDDFINIWFNYFDMERDYGAIKRYLSRDKVLKAAINYAPGIRILKQEKFECLISFIISQNNRIPMIKKTIENLCAAKGEKIDEYYSFPSIEKLKDVEISELKSCKTGFRADYIIDAVDKIYNKEVCLDDGLTDEELKTRLLKIKGVGEKVSDCVMLFAYGRVSRFPIDVWVKRVMEHFYFKGKETPLKEIQRFAAEKFGVYSGFAQQYLFNFALAEKIGKN
jgi:N-glycosylase/DNA lyase